MNTHKRIIPFQYKLGLLLFLIVLFISSFLGIFQFIIMRKSLEEGYEQNKKLINDRIINMISDADYVNMLLEKPIETDASQILKAVNSHYRQTKSIDFDLKNFLKDKSNFTIYVIDNKNTVIKSSNNEDIGLDFSSYPDFIKYLNDIRSSKNFTTSRISLSILESNLTKYCYLASDDGKYIFETGSNIQYDNSYFSGHGFDDFEKNIMKENNFVNRILLYDYNGISYKKNKDGGSMKISSDNAKHFKEAITSFREITVTGSYKGKKAYYVYIPYEIINARGANERNVVEVIYNDSVLEKNLAANMQIILLFVMLGAITAASLGFVIARILTKPIPELTKGILRISEGNLSYRFQMNVNDEFSILGDHFNQMTQKIQTLLNERYEYEDVLHKKNIEVLEQKEEITALYEETTALNQELENLLKNNQDSYFETVRALANAIEEKDAYTGGHCERVMNYSLQIANELNLSDSEIEDLKFGSILHDIGKIGISEYILNKSGKLTSEEYAVIKTHPARGNYILSDLNFMKNCSRIVSEHHERIDGKGYPYGISGDDIDYLARIVCVADAYDAMTSKRPYREQALTKEMAMDELKKCSGTQFDSSIVQAFLKVLTRM